ncbi:hypothetical protein Airi01_030710 [Actinoallomurus iriomotensis]|uniref:Transposase n=1 Tax=Actinoallomurus iriomotensis TaxID=478107 RepID=A0A9W6RFU6_9ACTN|nr:hypothetical protein Airi01_030710 [Actinoallomurus iriomotensis]
MACGVEVVQDRAGLHAVGELDRVRLVHLGAPVWQIDARRTGVLQPRLVRADTIDRRARGAENPPPADATALRHPDGSAM